MRMSMADIIDDSAKLKVLGYDGTPIIVMAVRRGSGLWWVEGLMWSVGTWTWHIPSHGLRLDRIHAFDDHAADYLRNVESSLTVVSTHEPGNLGSIHIGVRVVRYGVESVALAPKIGPADGVVVEEVGQFQVKVAWFNNDTGVG